ncbi:MAG: tetratricopeptide repeat protein [Verrucomicrobiales bacterium]|nr:tetratricopeptide repeat protein [Verrucomicrobiales bacterium]
MSLRTLHRLGTMAILGLSMAVAGVVTGAPGKGEASSARPGGPAAPTSAQRPVASAPKAADELLAAGLAACEARRPAEGLVWLRQAAAAGSIEAVYRVGLMLLGGASVEVSGQAVAADVPEGVRWIFRAATNRHPAACRQMAAIYLHGQGVKTNLLQAYAWLRVSAALAPEFASELDALALKLDAVRLLEAQELAARYLRGQWPPPPCKPVVTGDSRFTINGMTLAQNRPSVVINHRTFVEGETSEVPVRGGQLVVTCLEIRPDGVLLEIAGENEARLLPLR